MELTRSKAIVTDKKPHKAEVEAGGDGPCRHPPRLTSPTSSPSGRHPCRRCPPDETGVLCLSAVCVLQVCACFTALYVPAHSRCWCSLLPAQLLPAVLLLLFCALNRGGLLCSSLVVGP
jgi:hypothetical protein